MMIKSKKMKPSLTVLLLALLVTSCAPASRITADYDQSIDFSAYESFDWMRPPGDIIDPLRAYPAVAFRIKNAVEDNLEDKGFVKVDEDPDFYVVYHASVERNLSRSYIDTWGYFYPRYRHYPPRRRYPPVYRGFVYVDTYERGTLVIDIVDARTNELAWRGAASGIIGDPARAREKVVEAVHLILDSFPPYVLEEDEVPARVSE